MKSGTSILRMQRNGVRVTLMKRVGEASANAGPDHGSCFDFIISPVLLVLDIFIMFKTRLK